MKGIKMTSIQKEALDKMDEDKLRKMSSIHSHNKEIVEYIDERLESLNVDGAMVEMSEVKVGEV